jgi:hypothetical protein
MACHKAASVGGWETNGQLPVLISHAGNPVVVAAPGFHRRDLAAPLRAAALPWLITFADVLGDSLASAHPRSREFRRSLKAPSPMDPGSSERHVWGGSSGWIGQSNR